MEKVLVDTNVWIDWLNAGAHEDLLLKRGIVKFLSTVVTMELHAGVHHPRDGRLVTQLVDGFRRVRRLVVPGAESYLEAGRVLARLQREEGLEPRAAVGLVQDVLLATQARHLGATLLTANARHFTLIQRHYRFPLALL